MTLVDTQAMGIRSVLVLVADELSRFGLGCYGSKHAVTPTLDGLARQGLRFDAAYTPSPICVPARAAIATGRHVHEIGAWTSADPYDGSVRGWGHDLIEQGREVVSIGKLHYRNASDPTGFSRQIRPIHVVDGKGWVHGLLRDPVPEYPEARELARQIGRGTSSYIDYDRMVTDAATAWLSEPDRQTPGWVGFVSFVSPHYPLIAPEDYYDLYDPEVLASDAQSVPDHPVIRALADFFAYDQAFTRETRGIARAAYFGLCSFLDANIGCVLDALHAAGLAGQTLVIFTSDHGEMLGRKGLWTKSVMYEESVGVPLILAGPDRTTKEWTAPVSLIDLAPTILEAVAPEIDTGPYPGTPLLNPDQDRAVLSEYHDGGSITGIFMLRWASWKYVHYARGFPAQLFDLSKDPDETADLASDPGYASILSEGEARLRQILDPEAVNNAAFSDQAAHIARLGGRAAIESMDAFGYTPTK